MRIKDAFVTGLALVLSLATLTGMAYTEQFQQAANVEVAGFDALAHDLFDSPRLASGDLAGGVSADASAVSKQ